MLEKKKTVSQLAAEIPSYRFVKTKVACSKRVLAPVLEQLAQEKKGHVDTRDGVKIDFPEGWVHVRASNTEPIVRVYSEARTETMAKRLNDQYRRLVERTVAAHSKGEGR